MTFTKGKLTVKVERIGTTNWPTADNVVYIGRRNHRMGQYTASPLANLFRIGPDGTREEVTQKFAVWLDEKSPDSPAWIEMARLRHLLVKHKELTLLCHCSPLLCHGSVIADRLLNYSKRMKAQK